MDKRNKHEVAESTPENIGQAECDSALENETGNRNSWTTPSADAGSEQPQAVQSVEEDDNATVETSSEEDASSGEEPSSGEESSEVDVNGDSADVRPTIAEILGEREARLAKYFDEIEILQQEKEEALSMLHQIFDEDVKGEKAESVLSKFIKAVTFDREVAAARHAGEIAGRNAKIEMEVLQEDNGDGLPHIESRKVALREENNHNTIFDLAGYAR